MHIFFLELSQTPIATSFKMISNSTPLLFAKLLGLASLAMFSACVPTGYCLRAGPMPESETGQWSVADREKVVMARQMLSTLNKLESPQAKATVIQSVPQWFPSNTSACTTEYLSWLESRYLNPPRGKAYQANALTLAAVGALANLPNSRNSREAKARMLMRMYKTPLNEKRPYEVLPYEIEGPYPVVLPNAVDIQASIAQAMAKTYIVYDSSEYRDFLMGTIDQSGDATVRLILHDHMEIAMLKARGPARSKAVRNTGNSVALGWLKTMEAALGKKMHHLDQFNLYLRMIDTLGKHAKTLGVSSEVASTFDRLDAGLDNSVMAKSMAGAQKMRAAIVSARAQLKQRR